MLLESLSDDAAADTNFEHSPQTAIQKASSIVCVAGRNELDEAAASLLMYLLRSEFSVAMSETLPPEAVTSDRYHSSLANAAVVCLSLVSTHSPVRARHLVRRLCRRAPRARVLIGLWRLDPDEFAAAAATIARPNTVVAISLRDAVTSLQPDLMA